ncbi:MAG: division/cell wall cluster transcriptional repressor MraZ [Desulfuromonadales bacterium]|nr:division/cell wall cluster transcriptional repressor MraZ [Desulfuromonadales bacterium]
MGFKGVYNNSIDLKGRASIPARFREQLKELFDDEALVVTQDRGGIVAYPVSEWAKILANFEALEHNQFREDLYFTMITPAVECSFDKQGRIQLPQGLREYCQLDIDGMRDVVVVGGAHKIQIWNKNKYTEMMAAAEARKVDQRQKLFDLGL